MYFLSLFGYICMFVFVVWQINRPSRWVGSLTSVRCLTMKATIRRLKYVRSPQFEVWKLMSKVHNWKSWCTKSDEILSLMSDVCPKTVWIMSKVWSTTYVCSKPEVQKTKSEVQSMSKIRVWNQSLKSVSCLILKPKTNDQNLKLEIKSLKLKVYLKSVQSFLQLL